jgi:hypothetical protein
LIFVEERRDGAGRAWRKHVSRSALASTVVVGIRGVERLWAAEGETEKDSTIPFVHALRSNQGVDLSSFFFEFIR